MADSSRSLGYKTLITPMCHWLYFPKSAWFWKNLITQSRKNVSRLQSIIKQNEIDVVYTNTSAIFESAKAAKKTGAPHIWHVHEVLKTGNKMSQLLPIPIMQRYIRKHSDIVIFESNSARNVFHQTTPLERSEVVFNSLRLSSPAQPSSLSIDQAKAKFNLNGARPVICFVGQFMDRKNPLLLIEALNLIDPTQRPQCIFVGDGPLKAQIEQKLQQYRLDATCKIIPFQDEISDVLIACDALILPSKQESFGLVLIEATAYRKPVIACESQGPMEIISHGETGLLTPQEDATSLSKAILQITENPESASQMGEAGFRRTQQLFSAEKNTHRISQLIKQLHDN